MPLSDDVQITNPFIVQCITQIPGDRLNGALSHPSRFLSVSGL